MKYHASARYLSLFLLVACGRERPPSGDRPAGAAPPAAAPSASADAPNGATSQPATTLDDPVQLTATAKAGGASATFSGLGECHHTGDASIYGVPATMWSTHVDAASGDLRYVNLTLWQPKGASELQVSLGLTLGETTHHIATVKGADQHGSGRAHVEPRGSGGVLRVDGTDAEGRAVELTVQCSRFTEPVAEGG